MSSSLQKELEEEVAHAYVSGLRFKGETREERRGKESQANTIICDLQKLVGEKITPDKMDETLELLRGEERLSGTQGAAQLAKHFEDRSNLGQIAYVTMLAAANGTFDRERKINHFISYLEGDERAALEWLLFGRSPHLEWSLQHHLTIAYDYSRNLIHSARRTVDKHLPKEQQLTSALPAIPRDSFIKGIESFYQKIQEQFATEAELTIRQKQFQKKLMHINQHRQVIAEALFRWLQEWNDASSTVVTTSRWKAFKRLVRDIEQWLELELAKTIKEYTYFSVLRSIFVAALLPLYQSGETVKKLIETEIIQPKHLIAKPFRKQPKERSNLIPLSLIMGSKYVVGRPGSATVMSQLAKKDGELALTIWPPRRRQDQLTAILRISNRLQKMLDNGAKISSLVIKSSPDPSRKLLVTLLLSGNRWMFLSTNRLHKIPVTIPDLSFPCVGIGLDVNRVGDDILAYSEDVTLPLDMRRAIKHYIKLETVLAALSRAISRRQNLCERFPQNPFHSSRFLKLKQEYRFVHARRSRLLKEIHRLCSLVTAQVLLQTKSPVLCVEDLNLTARGTRGPLAKAILNLPDELTLYERAVLLTYYVTGQPVDLRLVDPRGTSTSTHVRCSHDPPGILHRVAGSSYDIVVCPACGLEVNTHTNAAVTILLRGLSQSDSRPPRPPPN